MQIIIALIAGSVFGAGLTVSGMINPAKVLNFLDFAAIAAGTWDGTLAVVFSASLSIMYVAFAIQRRTATPAHGDAYHVPVNNQIDTQLIMGAIIFGLGWGLVGLCPGPAIAILAVGKTEPIIFLAALICGIGLQILFKKTR